MARTMSYTRKEGLGPPIGDPDPSTEVADTHGGRWRPSNPFTEVASVLCGCRRPRWRGRGRRLEAPTPNRSRTFDLESLVGLGLGPPIGDPNPSTEVASVLCGCRRPR
ncbi:hypothetical protein CRG98_020664 [Punica granatum]|uniref:Uncharacterized protein n=1 Tax=Punica granatum TaxID=22663 RepID=A0A2I0JRJ0_PUNGR|nr:hypothetical protein CRG98_020664 [Punica granatum]